MPDISYWTQQWQDYLYNQYGPQVAQEITGGYGTGTHTIYSPYGSFQSAQVAQVPYPAPPGYTWEMGGIGPNGQPYPQLVPLPASLSGKTIPGVPPSTGALTPNLSTLIAPYQVLTFDTIGQTIYATLGHVRVPFRFIWVAGVDAYGDIISTDVITFAAALCAPLDPLEDGTTFSLFDGAEQVYSLVNGITPPLSWDPIQQALLVASLATAVLYPGTEGQDPNPLIILDKGADVTNAFRGLRYIVLQDYPSSGLPGLSQVWQRTNINHPNNKAKKPKTSVAVEFLPGAT